MECLTVDEKLQKMKRELNLTDEQVSRARPIVENFKNRIEELHEEKEKKLSGILSTEQIHKMKEIKANCKEQN